MEGTSGVAVPRVALLDSLSQDALTISASYVTLSCSCLSSTAAKGSVER